MRLLVKKVGLSTPRCYWPTTVGGDFRITILVLRYTITLTYSSSHGVAGISPFKGPSLLVIGFDETHESIH
jgi:hypothetical protein